MEVLSDQSVCGVDLVVIRLEDRLADDLPRTPPETLFEPSEGLQRLTDGEYEARSSPLSRARGTRLGR